MRRSPPSSKSHDEPIPRRVAPLARVLRGRSTPTSVVDEEPAGHAEAEPERCTVVACRAAAACRCGGRPANCRPASASLTIAARRCRPSGTSASGASTDVDRRAERTLRQPPVVPRSRSAPASPSHSGVHELRPVRVMHAETGDGARACTARRRCRATMASRSASGTPAKSRSITFRQCGHVESECG